MSVIEFDPPERFIADSVGPPGERVFFLQASGRGRVMTVSLEKEQVAVLGQRLDALLDNAAPIEADPDAAAAVADLAPLDTPIEDEFRVQALSLAWDLGRRMVVIEAHEHHDDDPEPSELDLALEQALEEVLDSREGDLEDDDDSHGDRDFDLAIDPDDAPPPQTHPGQQPVSAAELAQQIPDSPGDISELSELVEAVEAAEAAQDRDGASHDDGEGDGFDTGAVMRVVLAPAVARAFAQRCARAVEGGRPSCPFCGLPLEPSGHICPRANGYRR